MASWYRIALWLIPLCALSLSPPAESAEWLDELTTFCFGCHGVDGRSINPDVPQLAGQPYTLIEDNLLAFRMGKRRCGSEWIDESPTGLLRMTMCTFVANLSDSDIAALAEYFSSREFVAARQEADDAIAARGEEIHRSRGCERCHSGGGRETNGMAPVLAGQWKPYLKRALESVREGRRKGPKLMNAAIRELSDAEVEALLNFYASQQGRAAQQPPS